MTGKTSKLQDFFNTPKDSARVADKKLDLEFRTQLISFLRKCCVPEERIFNILRGVFFTNVSVQLVTSVPGIQQGDRMNDYGQLRLRTVLKGLYDYLEKVATQPKNPPILSQCSSIGNPSQNWIISMLKSCYGGREVAEKKEKLPDLLHIVFPTNVYVKNSIIGPEMAGSLIFMQRVYKAKAFLREMLKRYKDAPGRETTLAHSKYCRNWKEAELK